MLNQAYKQLQSIVPKKPSDKMSKIHTLKLALAYIDFLNDLLKSSEPQPTCRQSSKRPLSTDQDLDQTLSKPSLTNSPCSSINCAGPHLYATTSEDGDDYQHRTKRARFGPSYHNMDNNSSNPYAQHLAQAPTALNCYQSPDPNSYRLTDYPSPMQHQPQQPQLQSFCSSPSSSQYCYEPSPSITPDESTINLRDAFREYRSVKRKYRI